MRTPLERNAHARLSTSLEVAACLQALAARGRGAEWRRLGVSAGARPLVGLRCHALGTEAGVAPLRILLVGSQHGASEGAGCEALLRLARDLLTGPLGGLRAALDLLIVPNANPDGRDLGTSKNANAINLNRDFVLLSQPESQRLDELLADFAPHVVLDAHESAALKRRTLAREGYLTEFEAQFDVGNNPAIPGVLRRYAEERLLPALIGRVVREGLPAQRYFREILTTRQPITHGGLSLRRFRNKAALPGAVSVLLETRLDPSDGIYPTWRNIAVRVEKQHLCMRELLLLLADEGPRIQAAVAAAHDAAQEPLPLAAEYVPGEHAGTIEVPLRRIDSQQRVAVAFRDHRRVRARHAVAVPAAYWVTGHVEAMREVLARHRIASRLLPRAATARVLEQCYGIDDATHWRLLDETPRTRRFEAGTLYVPAVTRYARLLPLLLDPRSPSSVFRYARYTALLEPDRPFFVYREEARDPGRGQHAAEPRP